MCLFTYTLLIELWGLPCCSDNKKSALNVEDPSSIPGSERFPGEGNGYPLQDSCLENAMALSMGSQTVGHN